jgi:hypothetical protein
MGAHVADRILEVQNKYGCTLEFTQIAYANEFAANIQGLMYAEDGGDMVFSFNNAQLRKALGTGGDTSTMQDLLALDNILNFWNFNKWGNITSRETMMAGGVFYGVTPALWIDNTPLPYYTLVYNKDMLATFGITDPQEIWDEGKWDREAMMDGIVKAYDDTGSIVIKGLATNIIHAVRATFLSTGKSNIEISKLNADGTAEWEYGLLSDDSIEALSWFKSTYKANEKHFKIQNDWNNYQHLINGESYMALVAYRQILDSISVNMNNFGLMMWGGADYNVMSGFYENCYSVCIPSFAQDPEHTAFLMYDLFEGMNGIETQADMVKYYRETYFDNDLDVQFMYRDGANLQYSYWPNDLDIATFDVIGNSLFTASSVENLLTKTLASADTIVETHLIRNQIELDKYKQAGYFD